MKNEENEDIIKGCWGYPDGKRCQYCIDEYCCSDTEAPYCKLLKEFVNHCVYERHENCPMKGEVICII